MRILLELAFAVVCIYVVISVCIDGFLLFGILRAGADMYMDMKTPTVMQLGLFQVASSALIGLLVAARRWVLQKT